MRTKTLRRQIKKAKIRKKIGMGVAQKPRVVVFKSNKHVFVQAVNDIEAKTIASAGSLAKKTAKNIKTKSDNSKWFDVGLKLGDQLIKLKVKEAVFDRGGYKYVGRVKQIAEGVRKSGVKM